MWGKRSWAFDYFQYSYSDGWGYPCHSDYDLAVVFAYIAAYLLGIAAYSMTREYLRTRWILPALILCILGLISFSIEASHWLWGHHLSWIASCPAASLFLAIVVAFQLRRISDKLAQPSAALNGSSAAAPSPRAS
jgi:hypothetical protein